MNADIRIFDTVSDLTDTLADVFFRHADDLCYKQKKVSIVLSGGTTPQLLFKKIASRYPLKSSGIEWGKVHFFWCDERCVPPLHPDSNYGMANRYMLSALNIRKSNIHRIRGEKKPEEEVIRYGEEINRHVAMRNAAPVFDWIFLGMGEDGHVASIFPGQMSLLSVNAICAKAVHPESGQQRITLTGKTIMNADRISFIVTGRSKNQRIKEIMADESVAKLYPAWHIKPLRGKLEWYLDKEAAGGI
ncbi:MAG: 6-phosphogluconolactonase [Bacteroidales bacterium]|nr:6-phosphogluconolactonase [Bacteroidales bacterium]